LVALRRPGIRNECDGPDFDDKDFDNKDFDDKMRVRPLVTATVDMAERNLVRIRAISVGNGFRRVKRA
jgi:hypothetical protein